MAFWNTLFGNKIKIFCTYRQSLVSIEKSNPYKKSGPKTTFICKDGNTEQQGCDATNCVYFEGVAAMIHMTAQMSGLPTEKMSFSEYRHVMMNMEGMIDYLTEKK
jgi:hypothetical protein